MPAIDASIEETINTKGILLMRPGHLHNKRIIQETHSAVRVFQHFLEHIFLKYRTLALPPSTQNSNSKPLIITQVTLINYNIY